LNFIKRFFDFILFGNIYVGLGAVCLVQSSIIQLKFPNHLIYYSLLVFFSTLFVYNFQRFFYKSPKDNNLNSIRRQWIFKNQTAIKALIGIGFTGVVITFFFNDYTILFYLSPLLVLSLFYFAPFIKLRKSPWLKLLTLVVVWTMVTTVVPILLEDTLLTPNNVLHIILRFCFMAAICIPFDIRDLQIDKADAVSTIPQLLGESKARWLAFGFMILYIILINAEYLFGMIDLKILIGLMLSALINAILIFMSSSKRNEYFYVAGIDGTMILQGIVLIAFYYL
jgi:4-hydroxybenzoate polyprenyltransferase